MLKKRLLFTTKFDVLQEQFVNQSSLVQRQLGSQEKITAIPQAISLTGRCIALGWAGPPNILDEVHWIW